jgi:hypothetical protein
MRRLMVIALLLAPAGCGDKDKPAARETPAASTPVAEAPAALPTADPSDYSQAVLKYYGDPPADPNSGVEEEYHQPPAPAEAALGEPITLTGSNIGVRLVVTPTQIEPMGNRTAVRLVLENNGIAVYDGALENAALSYGDGKPRGVAGSAEAACSRGWATQLRLDVGEKTEGCLIFPADGDAEASRLQLALETVPVEAGGIWNLTSR